MAGIGEESATSVNRGQYCCVREEFVHPIFDENQTGSYQTVVATNHEFIRFMPLCLLIA